MTDRYLVQEQKGQAGEMVLHSRRALLNVDLAVPGQMVGIRYPHGGVGLVERKDLQAEQAYSIQHQRDRDLGR
ncbi:hypothetical protein [Achromobacter sp. JUb104]|uniref:KfrB domain-containing protein n=1 Tax=Achromobacter sp. JUb104 TaxID=2940590 RepID=UPI00216915D8|nr:hypothetical protein [Achromobacter sp. JUb104]MCS3509327.1 hypothetical protein [Achromobacter sp. JUb104]